MTQTEQQFKAVGTALEVLLGFMEKLDKAKQVQEIKVPVPAYCDSPGEWDKYIECVQEAEKANRDRLINIETAINAVNQAKSNLLGMINPHTWFLVPVNDGFMWVGKEGSDWPGDKGTLHISKERPEHKLQFRITN